LYSIIKIQDKTFNFKKYSCRWTVRAKNSYMGRFGGGWQYNIGVQVNKSLTVVIINLGIGYLRIAKI